MSTPFQAYTHEGLLNGSLTATGRLSDLLELVDSLVVEAPVVQPLRGGPVLFRPRSVVPVDDLCLIVAPSGTTAPSMASWHEVELDCGPYHLKALLPTKPGFDPDRYAIRPGGTFVLLGKVVVSRFGANGADGPSEYPLAWVNRYGVDSYSAMLDLDRFFPGVRRSQVGAGGARPH
ncbi:MAG: hypothetical protein ACRDF7_04650 [Candidatus Limnocylindrales bacterium]